MGAVRSGLTMFVSALMLGFLTISPPVAASGPLGKASALVPAGSALTATRARKAPVVTFASTTQLVVDVDPDLTGSKYWRLKLQSKAKGKWKKVGIYRTQGRKETRSFAVKAGTYRVRVYARPGYKAVTTRSYVFPRTDPAPTFSPTTPAPPAPAPDTTAPGPVTGLAVTERTGTSITLGWTNPADPDLASVIVRRAASGIAPTSPAEGTGVGLPSVTATSVTDSGLAANSTYSYALFSRDATGNTAVAAVLTTSTLPVTIRISVASDGTQANGVSSDADISADGRWLTYSSQASNLVAGDTNAYCDVFLYDAETHATQRISQASDSTGANGGSYSPRISADGRWITFYTDASNVLDDGIGGGVFLFDRISHTTQRVSAAGHSMGISADGRWIMFVSSVAGLVPGDSNADFDVFLFDATERTTQRISVSSAGVEAKGASTYAAISGDGRWITYVSTASNLVADDTNGRPDVFLFDRVERTTRRMSLASDEARAVGESPQNLTISADGRWIAYSANTSSHPLPPWPSYVYDVFLFDTLARTTRPISVDPSGTPLLGCQSYSPAFSPDSRWITYTSLCSVAAGDTDEWSDVFLFDPLDQAIRKVSSALGGTQANNHSTAPRITTDGRWVTYGSYASNLVEGDTNGSQDVFLTRMR